MVKRRGRWLRGEEIVKGRGIWLRVEEIVKRRGRWLRGGEDSYECLDQHGML